MFAVGTPATSHLYESFREEKKLDLQNWRPWSHPWRTLIFFRHLNSYKHYDCVFVTVVASGC